MSNRAFRSVTAKQAKDKVYRITGLNVTAAPTASAFSSGISASAPYIAIAAPTKGGIIPLTTAFEKFNRNENQPLVNAHPGNDITDFVFSPHNDFVLATSCATSVRVFKLPPTMSKNISTPNVEITGLNSVLSLKWHPTVRGLLAIACKDSLIIALVDFDGFETESTPEDYAEATETASGRPIFKCMVEGFGADICTMTWSADGSKIATVSKNGNLFVLDPRTHPFDQPLKPISLDDMKNPMAVEFTGSVAQKTEQVLVIGLGRARKPIYRFFDVETLQVTSQGDIPVSPGQLCTAYDKDTGLLAVLSRGGQSLCMFELSATRDVTGKLTQTFFGLSQIILASNSKGIMFASKHNLAVLDMEVGRLLSHNGEGIELYSLNVVRKERLFYPELFPPTASQKATNNFDDWVDGKNVDVELISLDPGYGVTIDATKMDNVNNSMSGMSISSPSSASSVSSPSNVSTAIAPTPVAAPTITQVLASAESSYNSSARKQLDNKLQRTIYQHTTGIEPGTNKETFTYQLRPASTLLPLGRSLVANDKFWALPWSAAGSFTIYVRHQETIGRVPNNVTGIRGTCRTLHTYDISTLEQHKIATVGDDGIVKVYTLPNVDTWKPHTELPADIHDATWEFPILPPGEGKTGIMKFSPYVEGVLVAAAFNPMSGQDEVHLLCVKDGSEGDNLAQSYNGLLRDRAIDLDFSPDGSTVAITGRDNIVSIISMPSGRLLHTIAPPQRTKELQVRFVDKDHILTIGYTRGSDRSVSLIKLSDIGSSSLDSPASPTPLKNVSVVNTSPMIPYYDIAANLLIIGNLGAASYNIFRVSVTEQPYIDTLSVFGSKSDILGSAFIHKSFVNVREVEVLRSIKFSKSGEIWPVSWRVPRKRKEFFQDDIYESGCAKFSSLCTADEFFSGSYERQVLGNVAKPIEFISLRPADMINLSEAPDEELTTRQLKYHQMKQQAAEEVTVTGCLGHKTNEETLDYFRQKASTSAVTSGRFDARTTEVLDDVSDSEWD